MRAPLLLCLALAASPAFASPAPGVDGETISRDLARELVDGKYDAVVARLDAAAAKVITHDALARILDPLRAERAPARSVVPRLSNAKPDGTTTYTIKGNWTRGAVSDIIVTVRDDGKVVGLLIRDQVAPIDSFDRYETKSRLRPPFRGTWTAHNAARADKNPHFAIPSQRFAVDWVMEEKGKSYRTDGKTNADFLCYGQDALAPADGTVAVVVDGIPENTPGLKDAYFIPGNHVVLDLGQGEFAMFMHLVPGSITVKVGQKVRTGEPIGKVGNSGNSSEPHLHFQLADKPRFTDASSLPAKFTGALLDGKRADRAWPGEGARLAPAEK
jgi:murein DD-endopeptidase MepM/ murein hydrolase activator NlpD